MSASSYEAVIGLEVHCQLLTESKAFSPESAAYGAEPNTLVDPVSLGHPGTLPVLNEAVVESTVRMGLATHCAIAERSVFARKHYFYPDLPKGYQISQYATPICRDGHLDLRVRDPDADPGSGAQPNDDADPQADTGETTDETGREGYEKRVGITRIHMEEDAGKSIHDQDPNYSLIDVNRCGVPLIEIVSEPDMATPLEAYAYLRMIRQIVRYLEICDGNMEEGSLRCDANVSVRPEGHPELGTKTEVKNMNSLRGVRRALAYEIERQTAVLERGEDVEQETRLWDADRERTHSMRTKEEAHDYRYFPDPDLVEVEVTEEMREELEREIPELPDARKRRFQEELGLPAYDAGVLTEERPTADFFEATLEVVDGEDPAADRAARAKAVSNFVMTEVMRVLNERSIALGELPVTPERLGELVAMRLDEELSSSAGQEVFERMLEHEDSPRAIAEAEDLIQVSDEGALRPVIREVIEENPEQVETYLGGKDGLIGFFIGQVMRSFSGSPDPQKVRELLQEELAARAED